jgi:hypothetical protein
VYRASVRPKARVALHSPAVGSFSSQVTLGNFSDNFPTTMPSPPKQLDSSSSSLPTTSALPSSPSSPSQTNTNARLTQIKDHTMGSHSNEAVPTLFDENVVPQAPEDPLFGLMAAYRKDTFEKKVDLGIGAYRDNNAKPWVLPVVKKVRSCEDTYQ